MLSLQEIFNKAVGGIMQQQERCVGDNGGCAYRDGLGNKCVVGYLIDDEHYTPACEGMIVYTAWSVLDRPADYLQSELVIALAIRDSLNASGVDMLDSEVFTLLSYMQQVHDGQLVKDWARLFTELAAKHNLYCDFLDNYK